MKIKTSELTGAALDWAVAKCEGVDGLFEAYEVGRHHFSTNWAQGGPIIERECITISALYAQKNPPSPEYAHGEWGAYIPCGINSEAAGQGPTPLIAAMRCYVASKLGDEVEIPEELA
jgi:hypothetical protein